jgi:hypothetical protein
VTLWAKSGRAVTKMYVKHIPPPAVADLKPCAARRRTDMDVYGRISE